MIIVVLFLGVWSHRGVAGQASRNILHDIVHMCLDSSLPDYCALCPAPLAGQCSVGGDCRETTDVWAETDDYVAIRDIKMCGCPADFVHGLAMARTPVSGVEDARRPAGIWPFAWAVARQRITEEAAIGLVAGRCGPPCRGTWAPELWRNCRSRTRRAVSSRSSRWQSRA